MIPLKHLLLLFVLGLGFIACAEEPTVDFYSADRGHPWNRLYSALLVRTSADGVVEDDALEPPLRHRTRYLLDGESNRRAVKLLTDFVQDKKALESMSPLQRAFM
jgi:hypothetical protein